MTAKTKTYHVKLCAWITQSFAWVLVFLSSITTPTSAKATCVYVADNKASLNLGRYNGNPSNTWPTYDVDIDYVEYVLQIRHINRVIEWPGTAKPVGHNATNVWTGDGNIQYHDGTRATIPMPTITSGTSGSSGLIKLTGRPSGAGADHKSMYKLINENYECGSTPPAGMPLYTCAYVDSTLTVRGFDSSKKYLRDLATINGNGGSCFQFTNMTMTSKPSIAATPTTLSFFAVPGRPSKPQNLTITASNLFTGAMYHITMTGVLTTGTVFFSNRANEYAITDIAYTNQQKHVVPITVQSDITGNENGQIIITLTYT